MILINIFLDAFSGFLKLCLQRNFLAFQNNLKMPKISSGRRVYKALISMKIQKIRPELKDIFTLRPFTRIVSWGRDFKKALEYQVLNQLEALGFVRREKKKSIARREKKSKIPILKLRSRRIRVPS